MSANVSHNLNLPSPNIQGSVESFDSVCKIPLDKLHFFGEIWFTDPLESPYQVSSLDYEIFVRIITPKSANFSCSLQVPLLIYHKRICRKF